MKINFKNKRTIIFFTIALAILFFSKIVFAVLPWDGTAFYDPGDTLNPTCPPDDPSGKCDVLSPLTSTNISNTAYDATSWDGVETIAPSKDAIRDKIEGLVAGSHDSLTIGTANGLSLATQVLSLALASTSAIGALSDTDWDIFNNKQDALVSATNIKTINGVTVLGAGDLATPQGTVTAVSVASANGFAGTSSGGATPALTLSTTITGILKGNGTAISAASDGSDYLSSVTGLKLDQTSGQTVGDTTNRLTKLWATDITVTNALTGSITGNAGTVTTNANLTGPITSVGNATSIASQTGTGTTFVMDTSPTIATPTFSTNFTSPIWKPSADSTTALQINKADGVTNVLNVDTTNGGRVGIGNTAPAEMLEVGSSTTGGNVAINATLGSELMPALTGATTVNWTFSGGIVTPLAGTIEKTTDGVGNITPTAASQIVAGNTYKIVITYNITVGTISYSLGGVSMGSSYYLSGSGTTTDYITAMSTAKLAITNGTYGNPGRWSISSISVKQVTTTTGSVVQDRPITFPTHIQMVSGKSLIKVMPAETTGAGFDIRAANGNNAASLYSSYNSGTGNGSLMLYTNNSLWVTLSGGGTQNSFNSNIGFGHTGITNSYLISLSGQAARTIGMERNTTAATAGQNLTLLAGGAKLAGTNLVGGDLYLSGGTSTGTGTSNLYFQTATAGSTGTADNAPTTKMTILGDGNVGIGTTSPGAYLQIGSASYSYGFDATRNGFAVVPDIDYARFVVQGNLGGSFYLGNTTAAVNSKKVEFGNENGYTFIRSLNDAGGVNKNLLWMNNGSGNVGIGTASPTYLLSLSGQAARTIGMERNTTAATAGQNLTLLAGGAKLAGTNLVGGDLYLSSGTSTGTGTSNLYFQTATAGSTGTADNAPTNKLSILGDGSVNVLAGNLVLTNTATNRLLLPLSNVAATPTLAFGTGNTGFYQEAANVLRFSGGGTNSLIFTNTGVYGQNALSPFFSNVVSSATATGLGPNQSDGNTGLGTAGADQLSLIAGGVEGIRITENTTIVANINGSLYIGDATTTPTYKLEVVSDSASGYVAKFFNDGNNANRYGIAIQAGADDSSSGTLIDFFDGDGTALSGNNITFTTGVVSYNTTSDQRLKNIIEGNSSLSIDLLNQIKIHDFTWKADSTNKINHGVMAQELASIYPDAVFIPTEEDRYWGVDYSKLVPLAIKSIQDIDLKINDINNFEKQNDWRDSLIAWFANAENRITRIFTGEICLTDAGEETVCINRSELIQLKALLNGALSTQPQQGGGETVPEPEPEIVPETPTETPPIEEVVPEAPAETPPAEEVAPEAPAENPVIENPILDEEGAGGGDLIPPTEETVPEAPAETPPTENP